MTEPLGFEDAVKRINEIAENLADGTSGSKGKTIIELRKLCGRHRTVPSLYRLEGVVKDGDYPKHHSTVTEIWKGKYQGEEVALKVLRVDRDEANIHRMKSRFCKEVVLMKQANHYNILPFYGVSTDVSDFCLVHPWYENGNITDYLKKNPDVNRFDLLSGAVNGLRFLHENRLSHGALRPSQILIDNDGNARLAAAGHSSIVVVPDTSTAGYEPSALDGQIYNFRYSAPEVQWPELYGMDEVRITKESDVYGMAMVIYVVLSEKKPYYDCNDSNVLPKVQAGEIPKRPSREIDDLVWGLLEKCWGRVPAKRPPTVQVYNTLSRFSSRPQIIHIPQEDYTPRRSSTGELPESLALDFQSIKFSPDQSKHQFYVKLRYGNTDYTTSTTSLADSSGEHTWKKQEIWEIKTNKQWHGQLVSLEVLLRVRIKKDKIWATGSFSLFNELNKDTPVVLHSEMNGPGSTILTVRLIEK